jgi:ubiquitin-protein ligase
MKVKVENTLGLKAKEDLDLQPSQKVQEVVDIIAASNLVDPNSISVTHNGKELDRARSLKDQGIGEGAVLRTLPRDAKGGSGIPEMPAPLQARLRGEAARVRAAGIDLAPQTPVEWRGVVPGAGQWRNQSFRILMRIPRNYPFQPPAVQFVDQPNPPHPNISADGAVCLNHLGDAWSPSMNLHSVFEDLVWLLEHPNYMHPLNLAATRKSVQSHWARRFFIGV